MKKKSPTVIVKPPRTWWPGDPRVEKYMEPVSDAIKRHVKWPSDEFTDIYNRAYEAVHQAIQENAPRAANAAAEGAILIADERKRHEVEGWTAEHDDQWINGELVKAAITYLVWYLLRVIQFPDKYPWTSLPVLWPWALKWWKPTGGERDLVKAGSMIAAEIDRARRIKKAG